MSSRSLVALLLATSVLGCREAPAPRPRPIPDPWLTAIEADLPRRGDEPKIGAIVFVVIDALRADYLGVYGSDRGLTPELDALGERSTVFESAFATSAWTRSSVTSMLTARYPTAAGVLGRGDVLPESATTLTEILGRRGFKTLGLSTNHNAGADVGFAQGFETFAVPPGRRSYPGDYQMVPAEHVTRAALDWVDAQDGESPLFLFLHYTDPHDPYLPQPEWNDPSVARGRFDGSRRSLEALDSTPREELTAHDLNRIVDLYEGEVAYVDRWVGRLFDGLEERGLGPENTLWIITADHGEGLWSHGWRGHGADLYEEMIRVPLILSAPGEATGRVAVPVSLLDLSPTVLSVLQWPQPETFQGHSLIPLLRGEDRPAPLVVIYSELSLGPFDLEMLRVGDMKLIKNRGLINERQAPYQLFDLAKDPHEQNDLFGQGHPEEARLIAALWRWNRAIARSSEPRRPGRLSELSPETLEAMKGLGYLSPVDEVR
ncbi:MAG: sulfatase [Planctomycetota bacterium]